MRVLFMGTGDIALLSFEALVNSSYDLVGLVTQPDKPVGRKQLLTPPRIKQLAEAKNIPVIQPEKLRRTDAVEALRKFNADVYVVMAYGQILSAEVLDLPRLACINLHASLLPKHRGASCIQAAITAGDEETGITVMHMSEGLDEGDVILAHSVEIGKQETGGELHDRLAELAPDTLLDALRKIENETAERFPQDDSLANYAPKLLRKDGEVDWSVTAGEIERKIRAYDPWPGTFCWYEDAKGRKKRLKLFPSCDVRSESGLIGEILEISTILLIACAEGSIAIKEVQPEGGKRMNVEEFKHSGAVKIGDKLLK